MVSWQMKWDQEKLFKLLHNQLIWLLKKEYGVLTSLLYQQALLLIGKQNLKNGVQPLKYLPIMVLKKKENKKEQDGADLIISKFA